MVALLPLYVQVQMVSVLEFTQSVHPVYLLAAFALVVVSAMICWTMNTTKSEHRAGVLREYTGMIWTFFDGLRTLIWGPPDDLPGVTV